VSHDVLVIGAGISGLSFAYHAARAGRRVLVVERAPRPGGCLHTEAAGDSFWIELGAHTCYNSYRGFIELLDGLGLLGELQARGKPVLRFLEGDQVLHGKNLGALLRRMSTWQVLKSLPRALGKKPDGQTVRSHYSRFVGQANYARALGPMLSAVPSQPADDFPADMLFKKRERRKDVLRSFTLRRGLAAAPQAIVAVPGITLLAGRAAVRVSRAGGDWKLELDDGTREAAPVLALATPPSVVADLLAEPVPAAAAVARQIKESRVDSVGVVVRAEKVAVPYSTFLIPVEDVFYSVVTRDVVPHPTHRGFVFHFRPGLDEARRLERIVAVLRVARGDLELVTERRSIVPSPTLGHRDRVQALDAALAGTSLALTGNWFAGLAIEDCVLRSRAEWDRVNGLDATRNDRKVVGRRAETS
jgi:protoporphyrinogen/coproporphyrinogen III oxidase